MNKKPKYPPRKRSKRFEARREWSAVPEGSRRTSKFRSGNCLDTGKTEASPCSVPITMIRSFACISLNPNNGSSRKNVCSVAVK